MLRTNCRVFRDIAIADKRLEFDMKIYPQLLCLAKTCLSLSAIFFSEACSFPDFSPEYAIAPVKLPSGQVLYFKREVRGINGSYDVIAISANSDPCVSLDDKTDYYLCSSHEDVYYKLDGATLHIYGSRVCGAPKQFPLQLRMEEHEIHPLDWKRFKLDYPKQGINRLVLTIKHGNRCK